MILPLIPLSIAIFEYHFGNNGDIVNDLNDLVAIETTWRNRVTPLATITNLTSGDLVLILLIKF